MAADPRLRDGEDGRETSSFPGSEFSLPSQAERGRPQAFFLAAARFAARASRALAIAARRFSSVTGSVTRRRADLAAVFARPLRAVARPAGLPRVRLR